VEEAHDVDALQAQAHHRHALAPETVIACHLSHPIPAPPE
jgi:hypothetical protein